MSTSPFDDAPLEEVDLPKSPLVVALCQVRFPKTPELTTTNGITKLHEAWRVQYPILREGQQVGVMLTPAGVSQGEPEKLWQFSDKSSTWSVTLADNYVTLLSTGYKSRQDLVSRFRVILEAILTVADPVIHDRIGLRYVNRVAGPALQQLPRLIRSELLGGRAVPETSGTRLLQSFSEAQFVNDAVRSQVRWLSLPPNMSHDPTVPPAAEESWVLDIDIFTEQTGDFLSATVSQLVEDFATRAYRIFRWGVTTEGLKEFGAKL